MASTKDMMLLPGLFTLPWRGRVAAKRRGGVMVFHVDGVWKMLFRPRVNHVARCKFAPKCVPLCGSSLRARQSKRSCGVVFARSFFATLRRIAVETMLKSPHPGRRLALFCAGRPSPSRGG